jgi:APA family basic amino acid/polyamine antiporter
MVGKLNFYETLAICIGAIMTTAICVVPGILYVAAGYGSLVIWLVAALITVPMGFCFAELAGTFSQSGGPFLYVKKTFGDFPAFVTGWSMWLYSTAAIAMLALVTSTYASFFFPIAHWQAVVLSILMLAFFTLLNMRGVRESARAEILLILASLAIYVYYVAAGLPSVDFSRFTGMFAGLNGALLILALEPFIGWETPTVIAEEVETPRRTLPKAIIITTVVTAALNVLLALVFLGTVNPKVELDIIPLATAARGFAPLFAPLFSASILLVGFSALNSWTMSVARLPAVMAQKKLFLPSFTKTNSRGAPTNALWLQFFLGAALCAVGNIENVLEILLVVAFVMYIISFAALLKIRNTAEGAQRTIKLPIIFPLFGIAATFCLLAFLSPMALAVGALLILSGIPAFVVVKLLTDKKFVERFWDSISFVWQYYWPIFVYRRGRVDRVIRLARLKDGQTILDHGAGSGTTTVEISRRFPRARIVADDISRNQIERAVKLFKSTPSLSNVIFVKTRGGVPYPHKSFDRIVCVLSINYFVNPEKELSQLHKILKHGGIAVFLAVRAPGIISHTFMNTDHGIRTLVGGAGFRNVSIEREHRFMREYIYITATK